MKLHRLRLRDFRGIDARDCEFPSTGVTVVSGPNEAGKSSMVEALDLLLEVPSASKSKRVTAVQPVGCDVATQIEAEISCGPWRFTYAKTYNKGQSTTLVVHEPQPEQLTGKAAHERVLAILDTTVDRALLHASRVMQDGAVGTSPAVSDSASVTRALDRAVTDHGQTDDAGGDDDTDLLAAVENEYARYYTVGRGQPTGELLAARQREARAQTELTGLEAALEALDQDMAAVERLTAQRKLIGSAIEQLDVEIDEAQRAAQQAHEVRDRHAKAQAEAQTARMRHEKVVGQRDARIRVVEKIAEYGERRIGAERAFAEATAVAQGAAEQERELLGKRTATEAALAAAREAVEAGEARERAARLRAELAAARARLHDAQTATTTLAGCEAELAANTVDLSVMAQARALRDELTTTTSQLSAASTMMQIVPLGTESVLVDGEAVRTAEPVPVERETIVEVPGVVRVELLPPADAADLARQREELSRRIAELCDAHGTGSVDELAELGEKRLAIVPRVEAARAEVRRVCAGADLDELRLLVDNLSAQAGPDSDEAAEETGSDLAELREAERSAARAHLTAERAVADHVRHAAEVAATARRAQEHLARTREKLAELEQGLDESRREQPDAELDAEVDRHTATSARADAAQRQLRAQLDAADLAEADQRVERLEAQMSAQVRTRAEVDQDLAHAKARIDVSREDARADRRDEAAAAHAAAQAELDRVQARASAAQLLRTTLNEHRREAHARFSDPLRRRLEDLAAPLFGADVRFTVDESLGITARTLDDRTVPFGELSVGTREQIGIIARLACAMLVDEADGVPVIIDDALGHSDSQRLAQMAQVLTRAGEHAQVIVLTCAPERYRDVETAGLVTL